MHSYTKHSTLIKIDWMETDTNEMKSLFTKERMFYHTKGDNSVIIQ